MYVGQERLSADIELRRKSCTTAISLAKLIVMGGAKV